MNDNGVVDLRLRDPDMLGKHLNAGYVAFYGLGFGAPHLVDQDGEEDKCNIDVFKGPLSVGGIYKIFQDVNNGQMSYRTALNIVLEFEIFAKRGTECFSREQFQVVDLNDFMVTLDDLFEAIRLRLAVIYLKTNEDLPCPGIYPPFSDRCDPTHSAAD